MELQQPTIANNARVNSQDLNSERNPHAAEMQKNLENPMARHYGDLVRRQPSKLARESAYRRLR